MFGKKVVGWDDLADSIISACWRTDKRYVTRHTRNMLKALRKGVETRSLDQKLLENLSRLAQFCCLEGDYAKAAKFYELILRAQERVLAADHVDCTLLRRQLDNVTRIRDNKVAYINRQVAEKPVTDAIQEKFEDHLDFFKSAA